MAEKKATKKKATKKKVTEKRAVRRSLRSQPCSPTRIGGKTTAREKFAVIKIGGSQELVREGDPLEVPRLEGKEGSKFKIKDVLLAASADKLKIGAPFIRGAEVTLKILEHTKGEKVEIRKFRAKSRYRRKTGHRQPITRVRVEKISPP